MSNLETTTAAVLDAAPQPNVQKLQPSQKAAVIVRLLLTQGLSPAIDRLSPAQQERLTQSMANLGHINRDTLGAVVREFAEALDNMALTFPSALSDAVALLEPHLSAKAQEALSEKAALHDGTDPWTQLAAMEAETLRPILSRESAEICAILLSKIGVAKAAQLLAALPEDRAPAVAHAVSLTATISPQTIETIGETLLNQIRSTPRSAFKASDVDRVGAILNSATGVTRDAVLEGIIARDALFGEEVRRAIFTFDHIPRRIDPKDVPKIIREVESDSLVTALATGLETAPLSVEFLLENMSKRMAEQLREEAEGRGTPRVEEGEAAQARIVTAIRDLESAGELLLVPAEE
ncbi:FliG C-terminal domain-containing protein [Rhodophyticola sp. SM2404]